MNNKFFIVNEVYNGYAKVILNHETLTISTTTCNVCNSRKYTTSLLDFSLVGKKVGDYYSTTFGKIVSKKFKDILKSNNIKGITFKEINYHGNFDKKGNLLINHLEFYEMVINGRTGLIADMNQKPLSHCENCHKAHYDSFNRIKGLSVIHSEWDGSDIFYFKNLENGFLVVSEKVKNIAIKHKIMNIEFTDIEDYLY